MRQPLVSGALLLALLAGSAPLVAQVAPPAPDSVAVPTITARGAFLRSLVIPGWGQSYVGAPGRGSIYFALEAGSLWMTYKTWREMREARALQAFTFPPDPDDPDADDKVSVLDSREEQFEDWAFISGFLLLFAGADAYVAAQLADFDDVIGVRPGPSGGVQLEARVPLPRRK